MIQEYNRINSWSRPNDSWFRILIEPILLQPIEFDNHEAYDAFGTWFEANCTGFWAYPEPTLLLFSLNEDKVKFILKFG